jgi:hypothetical protein
MNESSQVPSYPPYAVIRVWLVAGAAGWLCRRRQAEAIP